MATHTPQQDGTILTQRLLLRGAQESDRGSLHELFTDEDVMRYWSCAPHTKTEQTLKYLHEMIGSPINGKLDFVIVLLSPTKTDPHSPSNNNNNNNNSNNNVNKVIGKVGIWSAAESEIGLMLHSAYWKQGYMAEALTALLGPDGVFWERGVEWVVADVDPRNESCIGILTGFGFVETGRRERTLETHLGWCDSVDLELRKERAVKGRS